MDKRTAQQRAEALGERLRKSGHHEVEVKSREGDYGTFWDVSAFGNSYVDSSLMNISWYQHKPGRQGPQVKFYGGLATGYGKRHGKVIHINTIRELETWMYVCIESYLD
jgi:hypothetical protein